MKKKILFIGGSLNQTTIAHAVAKQLKDEYDCYFSAFYVTGIFEVARRLGLLNFSVVGGNHKVELKNI